MNAKSDRTSDKNGCSSVVVSICAQHAAAGEDVAQCQVRDLVFPGDSTRVDRLERDEPRQPVTGTREQRRESAPDLPGEIRLSRVTSDESAD